LADAASLLADLTRILPRVRGNDAPISIP